MVDDADEIERVIGEEATRQNPRKPGESDKAWKARLSDIKSRAIKIYWNDVHAVMDETGVDAEEARKIYRDALEELGVERRETTREEIVHVVAEAMEEEKKEPEEVEPGAIWTGESFAFSLQNGYESQINAQLPGGLRSYTVLLWVYRGASLLGSAEVSFDASPSTFWDAFHEAAREYLFETAYPKSGTAKVTMTVTEVSLVA